MDDVLQQGIAALKSGDKDTARRLLSGAVRKDPNNEKIWSMLYNAAISDKERIDCLNQVLRINPANEKAKQLIDELKSIKLHKPLPAQQVVYSPIYAPSVLPVRAKHWYRSTAVYVILFFLFTPLLIFLVLTDDDERQWTKIVAGILVGAFLFGFLGTFILILMGPMVRNMFDTINSDIETQPSSYTTAAPAVSRPTLTSIPQTTRIVSTQTPEFTVLPAGSDLIYGTWSIRELRTYTISKIEFNGDVRYPSNGRYAVIALQVINTGYNPADFVPNTEVMLLDGDNNSSHMTNFELSMLELNSQTRGMPNEIKPMATINPREKALILVVFDISLHSDHYLLATTNFNGGVSVVIP